MYYSEGKALVSSVLLEMLFAGWEVREVKNCDLGLEKHFQDRGHSTIWTDPKPVNNLFIFFLL